MKTVSNRRSSRRHKVRKLTFLVNLRQRNFNFLLNCGCKLPLGKLLNFSCHEEISGLFSKVNHR